LTTASTRCSVMSPLTSSIRTERLFPADDASSIGQAP
jgi:hypothetical protein